MSAAMSIERNSRKARSNNRRYEYFMMLTNMDVYSTVLSSNEDCVDDFYSNSDHVPRA